jgi:hypothetical protein
MGCFRRNRVRERRIIDWTDALHATYFALFQRQAPESMKPCEISHAIVDVALAAREAAAPKPAASLMSDEVFRQRAEEENGCSVSVGGSGMTREKAIEIARRCVKIKPQSYYHEPFQPHEWVIDAIVAAAAAPTPAPGAERLRERIAKAIWEAENAEGVRRNPRYPNTGEYAQWPEDAARQPYCQSTYRIADAVLREALAAAPPAPHPAEMALEHDRTQVAEHVTAMKNTLQNYAWLLDGRGSYEWNDDRYRLEFQTVCTAMQKHVEVLARIAADWSNCPTKWDDVQAARGDRHASAERVRRDDALNVITYFFDTHKGEILKTGPVCETLCARLRALPPSPEAK